MCIHVFTVVYSLYTTYMHDNSMAWLQITRKSDVFLVDPLAFFVRGLCTMNYIVCLTPWKLRSVF